MRHLKHYIKLSQRVYFLNGKPYWKSGNRKHKVAGALQASGHRTITVNQRYTLYVHRLLWLIEKGIPKHAIDHIDGNPDNNSIENLRDVPQYLNMRNQRGRGKSKYRGVSWNSRSNKWQATCSIQYKQKHLGHYDSEELAHQAYLNYMDSIKMREFVRE